MNATTANCYVIDRHLHDLAVRVQGSIRLYRLSITIVSVSRHDDRAVRKVGVDIGAAAAVPLFSMVNAFLNEFEFEFATLGIDLIFERIGV